MGNPSKNGPLSHLFDDVAASTLGGLPVVATFATVQYCIDSDDMPEMDQSVAVFSAVPAILLEIPVEIVKKAFMTRPEIAKTFSTFDDYHQWYMSAGDVPVYDGTNRWPCIVGNGDEVVEDGNHRLHSYIEAGHPTIPVLRYDYKAWWDAHKRWADTEYAALDHSKEQPQG
jgi:hypothetical protein